jgi:hypothetical protein
VFNEVCGESDGDNEETIVNWIAKLPSIMDQYELKGTANDDETVLFSHALLSRNLCLKNKKKKQVKNFAQNR